MDIKIKKKDEKYIVESVTGINNMPGVVEDIDSVISSVNGVGVKTQYGVACMLIESIMSKFFNNGRNCSVNIDIAKDDSEMTLKMEDMK